MKCCVPLLAAVLAAACSSTPRESPATAPPSKEPPRVSALDAVIAAPGATGLLVTSVEPGSQAANLHVEPGDILVAYGGQPTPDLPALNAAVGATEGAARILLVRAGREVSLPVRKGRIGVTLMPVKKGEGRPPLPPGNVTAFDFSRLAEREQDSWFVFHRGSERCGWGRIRARLAGDRLLVLTEEVYEDSTALYDHEVTCVTTTEGHPTLRMAAFRDRMNDWERFGSACRAEAEADFKWTVVSRGPGSEDEAFQVHIGPSVVPTYMLETLASFMPRRKGACYRFTPLHEGSGRTLQASALVCTGTEKIEVDGVSTPVYRFEWQVLGGTTTATYWLDGAGQVRKANYGEIDVEVIPADKVREGQPESILSR